MSIIPSVEYDYSKYICMLMLTPEGSVPDLTDSKGNSYSVTVDYVNRLVISRKTNINTGRTNTKEYKIDMENSAYLLEHSEINKIRAFERKSKEELFTLDRGYRDGWYIHYAYFTKEKSPITEGTLGTIYAGNPLEMIIDWIYKFYPQVIWK